MPAELIRRILICLVIAAPAIAFRVTGFRPDPVVDLLVFGAAVVAAAFLLAWAAEAAQKDISGALAIAILAFIAVLPEYAVDLFYAFRSGSEPEYAQFAAANMTGSNRLLLGFGWPLVVITALIVARRMTTKAMRSGAVAAKPARAAHALELPKENRLDIGFLALLSIAAFAIPLLGTIPIWLGALLVVTFGLYLWRASKNHSDDDGEEEFVGGAALIAELPTRARRATVIALFVVAAAIILSSAEPFAEALVSSGSSLGIDSYFLVQWLAPLASEAPEFIVATMFALRGMGGAAIGTLIASKVNQWSLLVGSLPVAHGLGGGGWALELDARQVEEFVLTASQTVMGVAIILALRFHWWSAAALAGLFAVQFFVPDENGRYVLSVIHLVIAVGALIVHRRDIVPTLAAPFRRARPVDAEITGRDGDAGGPATGQQAAVASQR
ncbi:sodium/hydrogen exchanger [Schumannella luteola]|uniref:Cation:H+ antiporter n=1 Tax=Schumannella luteola TaxID=472059 RepID=A0A852Y7W6_9MICO|nr:sodium:proton exchanger [Schumannella luteola]NYG97972.1 cation:H+ antiporter [Schumannella luteola]TPX01711.1 sodium:proton exchanger [Schumannella luteola]